MTSPIGFINNAFAATAHVLYHVNCVYVANFSYLFDIRDKNLSIQLPTYMDQEKLSYKAVYAWAKSITVWIRL